MHITNMQHVCFWQWCLTHYNCSISSIIHQSDCINNKNETPRGMKPSCQTNSVQLLPVITNSEGGTRDVGKHTHITDGCLTKILLCNYYCRMTLNLPQAEVTCQ